MKYTMSDGRGVGQHWGSNCEMNRQLQKKYNLTNSHDYRKYLQDNAVKIMEDCEKMACTLCPICKMATEYKP